MTDKEILQELEDQLRWYETQKERVSNELKDIQKQIIRDKRLIELIKDKINKTEL